MTVIRLDWMAKPNKQASSNQKLIALISSFTYRILVNFTDTEQGNSSNMLL